jgi:hypothetical protein
VDASAIFGLHSAALEQAAARILRCRFFAGLGELVWAPGIAGDFGRRFAVETSAMAFVAVHTSLRALG